MQAIQPVQIPSQTAFVLAAVDGSGLFQLQFQLNLLYYSHSGIWWAIALVK